MRASLFFFQILFVLAVVSPANAAPWTPGVSSPFHAPDRNVTGGALPSATSAPVPAAPSGLDALTPTRPWSRFGLGVGWGMAVDSEDTLFGGGFQLQVLLSSNWGMDLFFAGYSSAAEEVDQGHRVLFTFGGGLSYFFGSGVSDRSLNPYVKLGYLFKSNEFYSTSTAESPYLTQTAFDWTLAAGLQWRFTSPLFYGLVFSLNLEASLILPNGDERDDDIDSLLVMGLRFMLHF